MSKREQRDVTTLKEAEAIAAAWRRDGYRVGVRGQTGPNGEYSGLFVVVGTAKKCKARTDGGACSPFAVGGQSCEFCGRAL